MSSAITTHRHHPQPISTETNAQPLGRRDVVIAALLVLAVLLISLVAIVRAPEYSRYDEYTHADYAFKISHGQIPAAGDQASPEILEDWACRGDAKYGAPPCGSPEAEDPDNFMYFAYQYNFFHPPVYYAIAGVSANAISSVIDINFVTAARLVSAGIVALGIAASYLAIRSWRVRAAPATAAALALIATPMVMHSGATVNPDAMALLTGAASVFILGRVVNGGKVPIVLAGVSMLLAAGSKVILSMPLVIVAAYIGIDGLIKFRKSDRARGTKQMLLAVVSAIILIGVYLGWDLVQSGRGDPDWISPMQGLSTRMYTGLPIGELLVSTPFAFFGIGQGYWIHPQLNGWGAQFSAKALGLLMVVIPFVALVLFRRRSSASIANLVLLAGLVITPFFVQLEALTSQGMYFPGMTTRYGIAYLPLAYLVVALIVQERSWDKPALFAGGGLALLYSASITGLLR